MKIRSLGAFSVNEAIIGIYSVNGLNIRSD